MLNLKINETDHIYLLTGEFHAVNHPTILSTVLGSCIGVCLFDAKNKVAGLCHYIYPENKENLISKQNKESIGKYGTTALPALLNSVLRKGAAKDDLKAKIYGGAYMNDFSIYKPGEKNTKIALNFLKEKNIPILYQSTGGTLGRKISFNTVNFSVNEFTLSSDERNLIIKKCPICIIKCDSRKTCPYL